MSNEKNENTVVNEKIDPSNTFSRFIFSSESKVAYEASVVVANSVTNNYNPLFICGTVGVGKTHLIQSIGNQYLKEYPDAQVVYAPTEQFTNELIAAIRADKMQSFRNKYRNADVLMLDDVQFIEGKEYTQEEFFHTFNRLLSRGSKIILASDRPPKRIPRLQGRLCSRFGMGLIVHIEPYSLETRMRIFNELASNENINLSEDVIEYVANSYACNVREMKGALAQIIANSSILNENMDIKAVSRILSLSMEEKTQN